MRKSSFPLSLALVLAATLLVSACGSRGPTAPEPPEPTADAHNTVIVPPARYGKTPAGLQLSKADDACDVPASLAEAIQDQLLAPYQFAAPAPTPDVAGAPTLQLEITDLLANAGGLYGGPKIVQLRGVLDRPGAAPVRFTARREMFMYIGMPRSTCSMVGKVTEALAEDIARWLVEPVDGIRLGEW